jgi:hypothetical protein
LHRKGQRTRVFVSVFFTVISSANLFLSARADPGNP